MIKLPAKFIQLPVRFDVDQLRAEIGQFNPADWRPHPSGFVANDALPLIAADGGDNDALVGRMAATPALQKSAYMGQVLGSFNSVIGRSRLMRLGPEASVSEHVDFHPYWHHHIRVHIPLITDPSIEFWCDGESVHMAPGECWVFDHHKPHKVLNPSAVTRIHLVFDTTGSSWFWRLVERGYKPHGNPEQPKPTCVLKPFDSAQPTTQLKIENFNFQGIMSAGDFDALIDQFGIQFSANASATGGPFSLVRGFLRDLKLDWRTTTSFYGDNWKYAGVYRQLLRHYSQKWPELFDKELAISQLANLTKNFNNIVDVALVTSVEADARVDLQRRGTVAKLTKPIFLVSAPRSGSSFLFESLAVNSALVTLGGEGHHVYESFDAFNPIKNSRLHNGMNQADVTTQLVADLSHRLIKNLVDSEGRSYEGIAGEKPGLRMLEKTPKNALRISFLAAAFPDAQFIYLYRAPGPNVSSIFRAWQSGKFVTYPQLPDWQGPPWSMLLPAGWQSLNPDNPAQTAVFQWIESNKAIMADLVTLDKTRWHAIEYDQLVANPAEQLEWLCEQLDLPFDRNIRAATHQKMPLSRHTLTAPEPQKWLADADLIAPFQQELAATWSEIVEFVASPTKSELIC